MALRRALRHPLLSPPCHASGDARDVARPRPPYRTPSRFPASERGLELPIRDLVVIGASAGGIEALIRVVRELPEDLAAAVLVVLHVSPDAPSNLPAILRRAGRLPAEHAEDGDTFSAGRILIAPPDRHLSVEDSRVRVVRGPRENLHRPSVDVLFRSAALSRGPRTCAVILSGALDDGVSGMRAVQHFGGMTLVQSPADALVAGMPASVLAAMEPDRVLRAEEIGRELPAMLADTGVTAANRNPDDAFRSTVEQEVGMTRLEAASLENDPPGDRSPFGCPDCGGVLWEQPEDGDPRYRCRIGHGYTARALLAAEEDGVEEALSAGLRALEEQEALVERMLERPWASRSPATEARLRRRAAEARERAEIIRKFLVASSASPTLRSDDAPELAAELAAELVDGPEATRLS